jgi:chromosome segregation ATPase
MHVVVDCRCLDEWDVFLDAVNRKAISQELLKFSLRNKERQFIFISPQVIIFILYFFLKQIRIYIQELLTVLIVESKSSISSVDVLFHGSSPYLSGKSSSF